MPGEERTTKKRAQRIDMNYFKRPHAFRSWRFWLSVSVPLLAALWLLWHGLTGNRRVYSAGQLSPAHSVLAAKCDVCHFQMAGFFSAKASDRACLACHDGPIHHGNQTFTPKCSSCHQEHRGQARLGATSDAACTQCHADLRSTGPATKFIRDIENFGPGHPEFAAVRPGSTDPGTIKLNHAVHMKRNLAGPNGPVELDCEDCHRPATSTDPWRFGSAPAQVMAVAQKSDLPAMVLARAYMAPATYAKNCVACHTLQFDKRFTGSVPHDTPAVVDAFLVRTFQQYIASHPAELRVASPNRDLPQQPVPAPVRVLTAPQWVAERVGESEQLLWGKTCKQCHALSPAAPGELPTVAKSNITVRWLAHADFNHDRHQMVKCTECHAALTSQETGDVLLPGIATCEKCHHTGKDSAESRCFECHTYHDWTKAKEVKGKLTLSSLVPGN